MRPGFEGPGASIDWDKGAGFNVTLRTRTTTLAAAAYDLWACSAKRCRKSAIPRSPFLQSGRAQIAVASWSPIRNTTG